MNTAAPPQGVRVGGRMAKLDQAEEWVGAYTDAAKNRGSKRPYSFPGYDQFDGSKHQDHLSDGDLLAPVLLNVDISVRSFYELQRIRPGLETSLQAIPVDVRLEDTDDTKTREWVRPLFAVLDERAKPWGVSATKLSKVLHRKRPHLLVLHDRQVTELLSRATQHSNAWPHMGGLHGGPFLGDRRRPQDPTAGVGPARRRGRR